MGTTRIKVIDLSSNEKEIKTARKHAEKIAFKEHKKDEQKVAIPAAVAENFESKIIPDQPAAPESLQDSEVAEKSSAPQSSLKKARPPKKQKHHLGKNYLKAKGQIEDKIYDAKEAFEILPKTSFTKFDPSVEVHLNVSDKNIKGNISFPHPYKTIKKEKKFLIFADKNVETDKQVYWATEKTITDIESGALKAGKDFDIVITTPKFMPSLAKVAKILGPKGLMPNPKNGTIVEDPKTILEAKDNQDSYQYKTDPTAPIVHAKIGKLSQNSDELKSNLKVLITAIGPSKIKKATITTSMGPGLKFNASSI